MKQKLTELIISRKRWLTPDTLPNQEGSSLYNPEVNRLCCLGLAAEAFGYKAEQLAGLCYPTELIEDTENTLEDSLNACPLKQIIGNIRALPTFVPDEKHGCFEIQAAKINDSLEISNEEREQQLIAHFASVGIKLSFID